MIEILPFRPYRYTAKAGKPRDLLTQPYDKISPEMRSRYLARSPHNLVRILLGERRASDSESANVYTRAADYFRDWIERGILAQDSEASFYPCFQEFTVPDTGERATRKGFIGLGPVEEYSAGIVHRHEQTLYGPKKDRLELLRHTRAHFGQLFLLYSDPDGAVDRILDEAAQAPPLTEVTADDDVTHRMWRIRDPEKTRAITRLMADKKLLIADGHHRYETAQAFRTEHPGLEPARRVMMTLVNMDSPGLKILATHRLVNGIENFEPARFLEKLGESFSIEEMRTVGALRERWGRPEPGKIRIGVAIGREPRIHLMKAARAKGQLDVNFLHDVLLGETLGIREEAVREEKHLHYARGTDAPVEQVQGGDAQMAFLLEPTTIEQVARVSFSGGVMPQKSTDFYPKLLSGLTVYRLQE